MKQIPKGSNGTHSLTRFLRSTAVAVMGCALGLALWTATASVASAQGNSPKRMIQENLPQGKSLGNATKEEGLAAVCSAIKKNPSSAPQIVRFASNARREWAEEILRTAFRCAGDSDCRLLGRILRSAIDITPDDAAGLTAMALDLAPGCASSFPGAGAGDDDGGNFGNAPGNQNPPPGSLGGGGGQGNVAAICHNGRTIFVSPQGAANHLRVHSGDSAGPCTVTPVTNR